MLFVVVQVCMLVASTQELTECKEIPLEIPGIQEKITQKQCFKYGQYEMAKWWADYLDKNTRADATPTINHFYCAEGDEGDKLKQL